MPESDVERRLRETGAEFIDAHEKAAEAIRQARDAGMPAQEITQVSGLSRETVAAFLRASGE